MAKYNLLRGDFNNPIFAVTFDFYSPRPHFIILTKDGAGIEREFSRITHRQTQQLVKAGKSVLESFKIDDGILSIHRGAWRSETKKIHVHFCVDVESYLRVFESLKEAIPNWPNKRYVTKEWKGSTNPHSYAQNVRGYPYRSYLEKEVKAIRTNSSREPDVPLGEIQLEGGITKIVYHPSHPKIGFVGTKPDSIEELQQVLWAMEKFAKELSLTDLESKDENHGCHICLYLGSVTTDGWNFTRKDGEDVVGHIVMAGFRFYHLCPVDLRENWLLAYRQSDFKCLT
ncbi:Hypothetical predicted protein [Paramuricea clavata]|uniref:Uncharacterized protein n=1 Tax=Paramuricea clavata TaxID=317549 RepID=A0A7D9IYX9_PARCT|nr:Hypothetical predicted protein [Paramuricea clavata]